MIYARFKERFPNLPDEIEKVVYKYYETLIKVRIVYAGFSHKTYMEREAMIEDILDSLPDDVQSAISVLLLLTPKEAKDKTDVMNREFDDPEFYRVHAE